MTKFTLPPRPRPCRAVRDRCRGHGALYHALEPCILGHTYARGFPRILFRITED